MSSCLSVACGLELCHDAVEDGDLWFFRIAEMEGHTVPTGAIIPSIGCFMVYTIFGTLSLRIEIQMLPLLENVSIHESGLQHNASLLIFSTLEVKRQVLSVPFVLGTSPSLPATLDVACLIATANALNALSAL